MTMPLEVLPLAFIVGIVLGMLGGGGAILMVPMLVYVMHVEPKRAIATSLFVVGVTSAVSAAIHARRGAVRGVVAGVFGAGAMTGAFAGGRVAHFVSASALLVGFALMMLATATAMLRGRKEVMQAASDLRPLGAVILGLGVGFVSGLVGAGGGFLIVPALALVAGLGTKESIGTSLAIIALQSAAGFAGHLSSVSLDWTFTLGVALATLAGSVAGATAGGRLAPVVLRRAFGVLVLVVGTATLARELTLSIAVVAGVSAALLSLFTRARVGTTS